jgi:hypothetical protein
MSIPKGQALPEELLGETSSGAEGAEDGNGVNN